MSTNEEPMFEPIPAPESEEEQLKLYRKALEEEFLQSNGVAGQRKTAKETKEAINELIPEALVGLKRLIKFSSSESTKLRACTWVLENALSLKGIANTDDPLAALLEGMPSGEKSGVTDE